MVSKVLWALHVVRMVESRPWRDARVGLTDQDSARIDQELAPHYARARRDIGALV